MKNAYVTALTESILTGVPVETALLNVKSYMARKGHLRLWSQVLKASRRVLESRLDATLPQVIVAEEGLVSNDVIESALARLQADNKNFTTTIDPNLVGGFVIRLKGMILDTSYKKALLKLYRAVSKS